MIHRPYSRRCQCGRCFGRAVAMIFYDDFRWACMRHYRAWERRAFNG